MNASILGIMMFFFLIAGLLALVVGNPLVINPVQQVTINQNANEQFGLFNQQSTQTNSCQNLTGLTTSQIQQAQQGQLNALQKFTDSVSAIATAAYNGALFGIQVFSNTFGITQLLNQFGSHPFGGGPLGSPANSALPGCLAQQAQLAATTGLVSIGQATTGPGSVTNNPQVDQAIGIAVVFIGVGLLAGLFGAGILAGVISSVGIVISVIYFIMAEINLPNPSTGIPYFTLPTPVALIFTAFFSVSVIWMLIVSMNK